MAQPFDATLSPAALADAMGDRLTTLRGAIKADPLSNPVRELAHEISRAVEADTLPLTSMVGLVDYLDREALGRRAEHATAYLAQAGDDNFTQVVAKLSADLSSFEAFSTYWATRRETIVFTGHPTFMLAQKTRTALAELVRDAAVPKDRAGLPDHPISLSLEHDQAEAALRQATDAVYRLNEAILTFAKERYPDQWRSLQPQPIGLGTWVGYDMDGRTDIGWPAVIGHRLHEKQMRLSLYIERARAIGAPIADILAALETAHARTETHVSAFAANLDSPAALAEAANLLTGDTDNLVSLTPMVEQLTKVLAETNGDAAIAIAALRTEMVTFGLGMGDVHFRLNAAQIRHAALGILGVHSDNDLFGRGALNEISALIQNAAPVQVNFVSLATERAASARLFIAMKQILKHVDADSPIRLLIAECENPVTVLAAIYQARIFDVAHKVDVCPLFETALSLDRGRRILDVLFRQPAYRDQVEERGRICIETGFSDAGRFMGQVPAALAIERLQGQLADEMEDQGLGHLEAVIYDTHGESMGRGGHPGGIVDRCLYALSPWARRQFADRNITLRHEQSFQGGDGYVWFTNQALADRTLTGILTAQLSAQSLGQKDDPFYRETSASLDFFNAVKRRQETLFSDPAYNIALGAMGLSLLPQTGSRKSRRQFERQADEETSLRRIRAIPHNAILQQMGFLANILGGVGSAIAVEPEAFKNLRTRSDRFDRIMRMVDRARGGSDMKTLIAYMKLYDGSFWATRPISGEEPKIERACATLATQLSEDSRYFAGLQLAARLRSDSLLLSRALNDMGFSAGDTSGHTDEKLDLLHAVRIALIQRLFLMAADLPTFTPGGSFSREEVLQAIFGLDIERAITILTDAFGAEDANLAQLSLDEPADYPNDASRGASGLSDDVIADLQHLSGLIHQVSVGIANHFGALG